STTWTLRPEPAMPCARRSTATGCWTRQAPGSGWPAGCPTEAPLKYLHILPLTTPEACAPARRPRQGPHHGFDLNRRFRTGHREPGLAAGPGRPDSHRDPDQLGHQRDQRQAFGGRPDQELADLAADGARE